MSLPVRQISGLLLINDNLTSLATGLPRFLRQELAYLNDRQQIDGYSDIVTAACTVAAGPVAVQIPVVATVRLAPRASGPHPSLYIDGAGLLTIARAIATGVDILPTTFLVESEEAVAQLWNHPNAFVMKGGGVPVWTTDLAKFRLRVVENSPAVDLVVDTSASGMRLRAVSGDVFQAGADDDELSSDENSSPLSRDNLATFTQEGLTRDSAAFIIDSLTPDHRTLADLGHPNGHTLRKVFRNALGLKCDKPIADFVAKLPAEIQTAISLLRAPGPGLTPQPLSLDELIRCLFIFGDLDQQQTADLVQAMTVTPLVRGVLAALAALARPHNPNPMAFDLWAIPTLQTFEDFRTSIITRQSTHKALARLLGDVAGLEGPVRPATLRALHHRPTLPQIAIVHALDAFHRTFPKAPGCDLSDIGAITDSLLRLQIEDFLDGDRFTDLASVIAPCLRPSQDGLTYEEAGQANDLIEWIRECLEILTVDLPIDDYTEDDFLKAAVSIVFPPNVSPQRVRSIVALWHSTIDQFETSCFLAEVSSERLRARLRHDEFPHFLRGAATANFAGVEATVTPLATAEALLTEGREMSNCVSSLRHAAAIGHSLLVSIRSETARSTAEFRPTPEGYVLIRHEGPNSSAPDDHHVQIVASLQEVALTAPFAQEMLPVLLQAADLEDLAPYEYMTDAEYAAYKDLTFRQLGSFLTPSERKLKREIWTSDLLPLHANRFRESGERVFVKTPPFFLRLLRAVTAAEIARRPSFAAPSAD